MEYRPNQEKEIARRRPPVGRYRPSVLTDRLIVWRIMPGGDYRATFGEMEIRLRRAIPMTYKNAI